MSSDSCCGLHRYNVLFLGSSTGWGGFYIRSLSTPSLCRSYGGHLLQSEAQPAVDKHLKYKSVFGSGG